MRSLSPHRLCGSQSTRATCSLLVAAVVCSGIVWLHALSNSGLIPSPPEEKQLVVVRHRYDMDPFNPKAKRSVNARRRLHLFPDEENDEERSDPLRRAFAQLLLEPAHVAASCDISKGQISGASNNQSASNTFHVRPVLILVMTGLHMPFFQPKAGREALVDAGCPVCTLHMHINLNYFSTLPILYNCIFPDPLIIK